MKLVTALVAELQAREAAGLTAYELEQLVAGRGREVLRQMVQDHLDLRAAREAQAARERGRAVAGAGGITRGRVETGHRRLLATLFGTVQVTRCAWRRPGAGNLYPADAALSLPAPGTPTRWPAWPCWRRRAARSRPRTPPSPAGAGPWSASGRSSRPWGKPPPASP